MDMNIATPLLLGAATTTALYAAILARIQHIYHPDYTWLTVVGGNAQIGLWLLLWLLLSPLPDAQIAPLAAFWRLLMLNIAAGIPIIAWQLGQNAARAQNRRRGAHDQDTRRSAAD